MQPTGCLHDSGSVETRARFGSLRMVFTWYASSNLVPFGSSWHARDRGHCHRKPGREQRQAQACCCMY